MTFVLDSCKEYIPKLTVVEDIVTLTSTLRLSGALLLDCETMLASARALFWAIW